MYCFSRVESYEPLYIEVDARITPSIRSFSVVLHVMLAVREFTWAAARRWQRYEPLRYIARRSRRRKERANVGFSEALLLGEI